MARKKHNYKEVLIFLEEIKDKVIYPEIARKTVGEACRDMEINPLIFNHAADGRSIHQQFGVTTKDDQTQGFGGVPAVVFNGGKGFIRMYGFGESGRDVLSSESLKIVQGVSDLLNKSLFRVEVKEGNCEVEPENDMRLYRIRNLCLTKYLPKLNREFMDGGKLLPVEDPRVAQHISKTIYRGLIGQAMMLDEEMGSLLEMSFPEFDDFECQILAGELKIGKVKKNVTALFAHNLVFATPLKFTGPWFTGRLRSHGYGQVLKHIEYVRKG
jgi:hypothetical protein